MACVTIADEGRRLDDPRDIAAFLAPHGLWYERWALDGRVDPGAAPEAILAAFADEIERVKAKGAYVTADVIDVTPEVPGLEAMLDRFRKEHTHDEDEVRFIVKGRGVFHIHPDGGPVFAIQLDAGDMINVPAGTRHWFDLCSERTVRAIRFFKDRSGWAPHYVDDGVHDRYAPVCWGPEYVGAATRFASVVRP